VRGNDPDVKSKIILTINPIECGVQTHRFRDFLCPYTRDFN